MVVPVRVKPLDEVEQAVYYHSRERVRSLRDITTGLFRTLVLALDSGDFSNGQFGALTRPVTVVHWIEVTGASPSGVFWEIGSSSQGAGLSFDAGALVVAAGDGAGDGGVSVALSGITQGERVQVAAAISPGSKRVAIYVNGYREAYAVGVDPFTGGAYSDSGDGRVNGVNGTVTPRLGVATALSDAAIVSPVSVYVGQLPRGFAA